MIHTFGTDLRALSPFWTMDHCAQVFLECKTDQNNSLDVARVVGGLSLLAWC
jgi:hypothetical protein